MDPVVNGKLHIVKNVLWSLEFSTNIGINPPKINGHFLKWKWKTNRRLY
jgi:hypothetical protein